MSIILLNDFLNANKDEANQDSIDWARKLFHEHENTDYFDRNVSCVSAESEKKRKAPAAIRDVEHSSRFEMMKNMYARQLSDKTLNCMIAYSKRDKDCYHFQNMQVSPQLRTKMHSYLQRVFMRDLSRILSSPRYTAFCTGHDNEVRNKVLYTLFCYNGMLKVSMKQNRNSACKVHSLVLAFNRGKLNDVSQGNENMEGRSIKCWEVLDVFNLPKGQTAAAAAEAFFLKLTKQVLEMHVLRPEEVIEYERSEDYKRKKEEEYFDVVRTLEENMGFLSTERRINLMANIANTRKNGYQMPKVEIISWSDFVNDKNPNYLLYMFEQGRFNIFNDEKNAEIYEKYLHHENSYAEHSLLYLSKEVGWYVYDFLKFVFDDAARIEILHENAVIF